MPFGGLHSLFKGIILVACLGLVAGCQARFTGYEWESSSGYRFAPLNVSGKGSAGFIERDARATGITFINALQEEQFLANRHYVNGSGTAIGDVNGDGLADVYLAQLDGPNALYLNRGGWRFEEMAQAAGAALADRFSTGVLMEDMDGDGDLDLFVTAMDDPTALLLNDGAGFFTDVSEEAGMALPGGTTTATMADTDGDGDLDLYVGNYKRHTIKDLAPPHVRAFDATVRETDGGYEVIESFRPHYRLSLLGSRLMRFEYAEPDYFFENAGAGQFTPIAFTDGSFLDENGQPLETPYDDWALAAHFQDLNGDGAPDLYVCNDFESPDRLWMNLGDGRFQEIERTALRTTSGSTMSVAFADIERDGDVDFFLADMLGSSYSRQQMQQRERAPVPHPIGGLDTRPQIKQNMLLANRGDNTYSDIAYVAGVEASGWTWTSTFLDVDLDGYEDLLMTTGHHYDAMHADVQRRPVPPNRDWRKDLLAFPPLDLPNKAFKNLGDAGFEEVADGWGIGAEPDVAHGMALGDLDGDGDLDAVMNRLTGPAGVFENTATAPRIAVRLRGEAGNTRGIGSKILVHGGIVLQQKEVSSGGMYLSTSDPVYGFAAPEGSELTIEVRWRSGKLSHVQNARPNHIYEIFEADAGTPETRIEEPVTPSLFTDAGLNVAHTETFFDDFSRQPLVPRRISQAGPAMALADVDRDGDPDLLAGAGRGGELRYFENQQGVWRDASSRIPMEALIQDAAGIVVVPDANGTRVLVGMSNHELPLGESSHIQVFHVNGLQWRLGQRLDFGPSSVGSLSSADVDGDGDLDLFAAGHSIPAQYPAPASSQIYLNDRASFIADEARSQAFNQIGLVWGSTFGDVDQDGDQDLVLALEWGGIKLLVNDGTGFFSDVSESWGLARYSGWWRGVSLADFNGDGRLDLVASNWGLNSRYGEGGADSLRVYWGDFDGNGSLDVLDARYDPTRQRFAPEAGLNLLTYALPYLRNTIPGFVAFSQMSLEEVIGLDLSFANRYDAATLGHHVFLNEGGYFTAQLLPRMTQVAPGFGLPVGDFNGDGCEDVFLAQNFFAEQLEVPRNDAGRGVLMEGNCEGSLFRIDGQQSGIKVYGEQRAATAGDFDGDGRLDLIVSQNGEAFKGYQNQGALPGIHVRLQGPTENPWGIGATLRLRFADESSGPARLVSAGSGYWTQQAIGQVLGTGDRRAVAVEVIWPGGEEQTQSIEAGTRAVTVVYSP